jgi:maltodextrin utilization protein YvdJ
LLISFIEDKSDAQLESRLDENNYDDSQLISITIPVTKLSYYNNSILFERVDGQLEINGVQYKYVKRRLYNDSVELMCIPNQTAIRLSNAKNDFFKVINDIQHKENRKTGSGLSKNISADYLTFNQHFLLMPLYLTASSWMPYSAGAAPFNFSAVIENPPEKTSPFI